MIEMLSPTAVAALQTRVQGIAPTERLCRNRLRRVVGVAGAAILLAAISGCGSSVGGKPPLRSVPFYAAEFESPDMHAYLFGRLTARGCSIHVDESGSAVQVSIRCRTIGKDEVGCLPKRPCAAATYGTIQLKAPIGVRKIIDKASGEAQLVCRSPLFPSGNAGRCVPLCAYRPGRGACLEEDQETADQRRASIMAVGTRVAHSGAA